MLPLLPKGQKKVVRDAARAVKQKANWVIEQVSTNSLSALLGLPGIIVTGYAIERREGREILHLFCRHEQETAVCPRCGQVSTVVHEQEERCIRHLDIWGKPTYVHFPSRRFDCPHCKKPFTESLS